MALAAAATCLHVLTGPTASAQPSATQRETSLAPPVQRVAGPGPAEVWAHPDPLLLLDDESPSLAANKRLVFDMWRGIVNAGHVELADRMLQAGYIQHSPVLPTGRAAFKQIFSVVERRDIPELVSPALVTILAEGPLVVMALREELSEPGRSETLTTTHFNLFRIHDGRLAEHWHSVQSAPGADVRPPSEGGPQPVIGLSGPSQASLLGAANPLAAANKRLVFDAWREIFEGGREGMADTYLAHDYIEHDPNGFTGRAAFKSSLAGRADEPVAAFVRAPLVALLAQGDLVVLVTAREHPHPSRAGATYYTTHFNMFRIEHNLIAEHWSGEPKPGASAGPY